MPRPLLTLLPSFLTTRLTSLIRSTGYQLVNLKRMYEFDGLHTVHNASFRDNPRFRAAYLRAIQASHGVNPHTEWRTHIGLWAASTASRIPGDFVECGVNAGFLSTAILSYLDWASLDKQFYLVDTFEGPVLQQFSAQEIKAGRLAAAQTALAAGAYVTDLARIHANYSEWPRVHIVKGCVPDILPAITTPKISFLHLDMNCAYAEAAALRHFWPRLSAGSLVLFDDYAYFGYEEQARSIDAIAAEIGAGVLSLPTGQGLIIR